MEGKLLLENNADCSREIKNRSIRESKKHKGYCDTNGNRLLNVIYFLDKINNELKMINSLNNIEYSNSGIGKIEGYYLVLLESLFIISDCINNCRLMDFDNENHLQACKFLDESITSKLQKLKNDDKKYFKSIDEDINKYRLIFNSKLEESTSLNKVISKYSFA